MADSIANISVECLSYAFFAISAMFLVTNDGQRIVCGMARTDELKSALSASLIARQKRGNNTHLWDAAAYTNP
ncbi:MAG: hypothetical protein Q8R23_04785 [Methylotenera sp.]|jgi:hypothetical protein|nr:hypothetical protein [Methylotenera sp.]